VRLEDLRFAETHGDLSRRGGKCVVDVDHMVPEARAYFRRAMMRLRRDSFWTAADSQNAYRPSNGLWAPQRRAVAVCLAYLGARNALTTSESALVKMPTGTGKTAVIATLACALPDVRRTLIITPQRALVDQLLADVQWRFWSNFGLVYDGDAVIARPSGGAPLRSDSTSVVRLLPSKTDSICRTATNARQVVVGTFKALEQIMRPARPAHRMAGAARHEEDDNSGQPTFEAAMADRVRQALTSFDLVIVDEGHYEPAFVWSQCIRDLALPTVLFSATPYRNDFKYFAVKGNFAFNLSYSEAISERLIRPVTFAASQWRPATESAADFVRALRRYYDDVVLQSPWPAGAMPPRVIVRGEDFESLGLLRDTFVSSGGGGARAVLIHDKISKDDVTRLEFRSVQAALASAATAGVPYWLHQWKLLEGVDEKAFSVIAVYQEFRNSRAAIQQLGRVLRYLDARRATEESASVFGATRIVDDYAGRFERYQRFETYFDRDPGNALAQEARLPSVMLREAPEYQYLFGDFCGRLGLDDTNAPSFDDFRPPLRVTVLRSSAPINIDLFSDRCKEAMGLEDRYEMRVIKPRPLDPQNVRLVIYLTWQNSGLLVRHAFPIWNLGLMAIVQIGNRAFVSDTEGLVVDIERLGLETEPPENMRKLVPQASAATPWRVGQASATGLDLSDSAIRSVTARMHDFSEGFFDLAQMNQALNSVRAHSRRNNRSFSRYLSLGRSAVSDTDGARDEQIGIAPFVAWLNGISSGLDSAAGASRVFDRFARSVPAPPAADAEPLNVLFDFEEVDDSSPGTVGWRIQSLEALRHAEVCLDVGTDGSFVLRVPGLAINGNLKYQITGSIHRRGRYVVESPDLDRFVQDPAAAATLSFVKAINKVQALRVVPLTPELTYAKKTFYRAGLDVAAIARGEERGTPLEYLRPSAWMQRVTSEKGAGGMNQWVNESIFGGMFAHYGFPNLGRRWAAFTDRPIRSHDPLLADELDTFETVVCDDGGQEWADFMLVSHQTSKVVFLHAKVGDSMLSLNAMQIVGRQAQAGISFMVRGSAYPERAAWWRSPWMTDDGTQVTKRILRSPAGANLENTWTLIENAVLSGLFRKEIWIWAGASLSKRRLVQDLTRANGPTPRSRQMAYYLASLQTSAARASIGMQIFCSP
jgi:hypothetical protein